MALGENLRGQKHTAVKQAGVGCLEERASVPGLDVRASAMVCDQPWLQAEAEGGKTKNTS